MFENSKRNIETTIKKVIYHNSENGFCVLLDENEKVFEGFLPYNPKNIISIPIVAMGCKKSKTKYGIRYKFEEIKDNVPFLFHFLTEIVKGVKKESALEIANKYKSIKELEYILENNEAEILAIKGIGPKRLEKMKRGLKEEKEFYKLAELLLPYSVSPKIIKKIYNKYKNVDIVSKLKEDPYTILTSIDGIGFKRADEIVLKASLIPKDSIFRAKAAILYSFRNLIDENGSILFTKDEIKKSFYSLLSEEDFSETKFNEAFEILLKEDLIVKVENNNEIFFCFTDMYKKEDFIYSFIFNKSYQFSQDSEEIELAIKKYEYQNQIELDKTQKEAVKNFLVSNKPIYIIAGYAGTGKTTTSKAIISYLREKGKNIIGCALSGAAANRLKNVASVEAKTIHSLLGYKKDKKTGKMKFTFNEKNKLDYDLIIIDEASMVNSSLMFHLMKAVNPNKTKILMLGDNAQLPPVGWGEVFNDLLKSDMVDKTILTKIHRQDPNQVITLFASEIRKGNLPLNYKGKNFKDFRFVSIKIRERLSKLSDKERRAVRENNNLLIRGYILKGFNTYKESILKSLEDFKRTRDFEDLRRYLSRIQLISPTKKGILGTFELNQSIKNILNPITSKEKEYFDYIHIPLKNGLSKKFSKFDKVIHLKNKDMICSPFPLTDYDLEMIAQGKDENYSYERVYNGQVGLITNFYPVFNEEDFSVEEILIEVAYPNEGYYVYYSVDDFANEIIDLSYAITIHKSQGQEYESVIIPITMSHFRMLNSKLMYTAITRAKDRVRIVGEDSAFRVACQKLEETDRRTLIKVFVENENDFKNVGDSNQENIEGTNIGQKTLFDDISLPF